MVRCLHVSDVHVHNLKYHKEQREVFGSLYQHAREEKPDLILASGDLFHVKNTLSAESVQMVGDFLKNLADIAPTIVTVGNHDTIQRNKGRLDSISPVVSALDHADLTYAKQTTIIDLNDDFDLTVLGILDEEEWENHLPRDNGKTHLVTFHGSVKGYVSDTGWVSDRGDIDVSFLENWDYGLLGDIHEPQAADKNNRFLWAGSLCQNNHGEKNNKGFLVWDIEDRNNFNVRHIHIPNPKPFMTLELTDKGNLPRKTEVAPNTRLRIVANHKVSLDKIRRSLDIAAARFKPESLSFVNKAGLRRNDISVTGVGSTGDLRNAKVQERLIREYLKDYKPTPETLQKVFELNDRCNRATNLQTDVRRNIQWNLIKVEWDNLFNYGEGNCVDFTELEGCVGILGPNGSGKSSVVDCILYTVFNSISKNNRKNLNVINQNKMIGKGKVEIDVAGKIYTIERVSTKYTRKLHGEETEEAKTDVEFSVYDPATDETTSLNSIDRNGTDKEIRKIFGNIEDFLLTSMAPQLGAMTFLNEGSTKRKEILARFLDLDQFERKFRKTKEDSLETRALLRKMEDNSYDEDIATLRKELKRNEATRDKQQQECAVAQGELSELVLRQAEIVDLFASAPVEVIHVAKENNRLTAANKELVEREQRVRGASTKHQVLSDRLEMYSQSLKTTNTVLLEEQIRKAEEVETSLKDTEAKLQVEQRLQKNLERQVQMLGETPCDENCPLNHMIEDTSDSKQKLHDSHRTTSGLLRQQKRLLLDQQEMNLDEIREQKQKYDDQKEKESTLSTELMQLSLTVEKTNNQLHLLRKEIGEIEQRIELYEQNKEAIENKEDLLAEVKSLETQKKITEARLTKCEVRVTNLLKQNGGIEQQILNLQEKKEELETLRTEYAAADLYMRAMHPSGISYEILKEMLPLINDEVSKVLANLVDYEVLVSAEGRKLEIAIKHPKYDPRPIEMASGAEKALASIALRIALTNISTMPKSSFVVLDEPVTALDAENLANFTKVLDMLESYYKTVILITHLTGLHDAADQTIEIEKKAGYAYCNQ